MARFGPDKIEEVRARADIVEIVGAQVRLKRAGRNFVGLCPFHNEKTPSFSVNAERGFFHCFGCGVGGTVFDFVMKVEGLTFAEALQSLARRYGIVLPEHSGPGGPPPGERDALALANLTAAEFFAHVLWKTADGAPARDYLKARGITEETAHAFMLGFAPARPANLAAVIGKRGMLEAAVKVGLVKRETGREPYDMFRARLMFPIRDAQGRVIGFGGRVLDQRLPKYINSPESPIYSKARALYGVFEARQAIAHADRAIVVEGNIDVIALWQAGFKETVASLGTSLTVDQLRLLARYTRNIIACFDGDAAGRKASLRALGIFLGAGLLGRGAFIPSGFDPDTLVRDRGAQAFTELIATSEPLVDYFMGEELHALGGFDAKSDKRAEAVQRIGEKLRLVPDKLQFDLLVSKAITLLRLGQSEEKTLREFGRQVGGAAANQSKRHTGGAASTSPPSRTMGGGDAVMQAKFDIIAIALLNADYRGEIFGSGIGDRFEEQSLKDLLLEVCLSEKNADELTALLSQRLDPEQMSFLIFRMSGMEDPKSATDAEPFNIPVFKEIVWGSTGHILKSFDPGTHLTGCIELLRNPKKGKPLTAAQRVVGIDNATAAQAFIESRKTLDGN